jgi:hypothetical protein
LDGEAIRRFDSMDSAAGGQPKPIIVSVSSLCTRFPTLPSAVLYDPASLRFLKARFSGSGILRKRDS